MQESVEPETQLTEMATSTTDPTTFSSVEIRVRGRSILVPSVTIDGRTVVVTGNLLKLASVRDEDLWQGETVSEPRDFVSQLREYGLRADLFTFAQRIPDTRKQYDFYTEWSNDAALPVSTYDHWLKKQVGYSTRKAVNKSQKMGVIARRVDFDDNFVRAICRVYAESPTRQGRAFWHYNKGFEAVKHELGTYLDRSVFIGTYFENELIGSLKMTYVGPTASIMQIFCSQNHFDKRPNNALIAKAVEICEQDNKSHLIYGNFTYHDVDSSLTEFKRRNGFEPVLLPRYYLPLTLKGSLALRLGLHRGLVGCIPPPVLKKLRDVRAKWYARQSKQSTSVQQQN